MEKDRSPVIDENLSPISDENPHLEDENLHTAMDENSSPNARGRPFGKGKSGNPAGRPKGSRNRTTLAAEALLDGQAEAIMLKLVDMALAGDLTALRMCIDRILPVRRERRVSYELPHIGSDDDVVKAMEGIANAVASGELSFSESHQAASLVMRQANAIRNVERRNDPMRGVREIILPDHEEDC